MTACPTTTASASPATSASEAKRQRLLRATCRFALTATTALTPVVALAQVLPTGGSVAEGTVAINQTTETRLTVTQGSNNAVVNWQSFNVGEGFQVDFEQPGPNSAILNRVTGNTTSQIRGQITADGAVHLVNPNGIFIGPTGEVFTQGFVASTLGISDEDFMAGRYTYSGSGASASVINQGLIRSFAGGYAALLGGHVSNSGVISVRTGRIGLGSGERVTLNLSGDGFMQVALPTEGDDPDLMALVENSGQIDAAGGRVEMLAATARDAARNVVNMSGVVEARTVGGQSGAIVFGSTGGGTATVTGQVLATATAEDSSAVNTRTGGAITISAGEVDLLGAYFDTSGTGGGGEIHIGQDPDGVLQEADRVMLDATSRLIASATDAGNGGLVYLGSTELTQFYGGIVAQGGASSGDGGTVEIFTGFENEFEGTTDTTAPNGDWGSTTSIGTSTPYYYDIIEPMLETNGLLSLQWVDRVDDYIGFGGTLDWSSDATLEIVTDGEFHSDAVYNAPNGTLIFDAGTDIVPDPASAINVDTFAVTGGDWFENGTLSAINVNNFYVAPGSGFFRAAGGTGQADDPFVLTDIYGLQGGDIDGIVEYHYVLGNDIDASMTRNWVRNADPEDPDSPLVYGFEPLDRLDGTLDGQNYTISGIYMDRSESPDANGGLAAPILILGETGQIRNLYLSHDVIEGVQASGLVYQNDGAISDVNVSGTIRMSDEGTDFGGPASREIVSIGGYTIFPRSLSAIASNNYGTIDDSTSDADLQFYFDGRSPFSYNVGGLAGYNTGAVRNSFAFGDIATIASHDVPIENASNPENYAFAAVGGLIGNNDNRSGGAAFLTGSQSSTRLDLEAYGLLRAGSMVGQNNGVVFGSYGVLEQDSVLRAVSGNFGSAVGQNTITGVIDQVDSNHTFEPFQVAPLTSETIPTDDHIVYAGGFVGRNAGLITNSISSASISIIPNADNPEDSFNRLTIGGFAGRNIDDGNISLSYATGGIDIAPGVSIQTLVTGPFAGRNEGFFASNFYDSDLFGPTDVPDFTGSQGLTTAEFQDTEGFYYLGSDLAYDFENVWAPGEPGRYPWLYATWAIAFAVPDPLSSPQGTATGEIYGGPAVFTIGRDPDGATIDPAQVFGDLVFTTDEETQITTFVPAASSVTASDGSSYTLVSLPGLVIDEGEVAGPTDPPVPAPAAPAAEAEYQEVVALFDSDLTTSAQSVEQAEETLATVEGLASALVSDVERCSVSAGAEEVLSCLAEGLDEYGRKLDQLKEELPPGMENIGGLIDEARTEVLASREKAVARLADATTEAQRSIIQQEAIDEARATLQSAQREIRSSIGLIRVSDPELVALQTQQIETVAASFDQLDISLARVTEL